MAALYGIDIFDTDGRAIEPGLGGAHFESDTPFPIPRNGESILSMGREFTVENVTYEYKYEEESPHRLIAAATIICRPKPK
jgi:hypothetical protein